MFNIGIHGSHNAAVAISFENKVLEVVEIERLLGKKNAALFFWSNVKRSSEIFRSINNYFSEKYNVHDYDNLIFNSIDESKINLHDIFKFKNKRYCSHHEAHALNALYQSPFDNALIISFDGGSDEGFFNIYLVDDRYGKLKKIYSGQSDYATSYMACAHFIPAIKREEIYSGNLVYAGKLMGYAGYGKPREEYIEKLNRFYDEQTDDCVQKAVIRFGNIFEVGYRMGYRKHLHRQKKNSCFEFYGPGFLDEQDAKDIAASNQFVFEQRFYEEIKPFLDTYHDYPVILTGGCALNILNNTSIARKREEIFIPPNPNDSGIALGCLFSEISPFDPVDATYLGPDVWDKMELSKYLIQYPDSYHCSIDIVGQKLLNGQIIGVVRGRSELGPRALGNRSLLTCAHFPTSKEYVNSKVKHREAFRPLSPIVRLEDVNKYFEWETESRHMTFSPKVREEWRETLYAVTHVDGTARVQTVTRDQNEFIYDLLTYIDNAYGVAVLLNTSFNVAGKPILNTYREAFEVLETKPINGILIEDHFFPSPIIDSNTSAYYHYPYKN